MRCISAVLLFAAGAISKEPHHKEMPKDTHHDDAPKNHHRQETPETAPKETPNAPQAPKPFNWHHYVPSPPPSSPSTGAGGAPQGSGASPAAGAGSGVDWHSYIPTPPPAPKPSANTKGGNQYANPYWGGLAPSTPSPYAPGGAMAGGRPGPPPAAPAGGGGVPPSNNAGSMPDWHQYVGGGAGPAPVKMVVGADNSAFTTIEAAEAGAQCAKKAGSQVPLSTLLNDAKKIDAENNPRAALPEGEKTVCGVLVRTHDCVSKTSFAGNAIFAPLNTAAHRCSALTAKREVAAVGSKAQLETRIVSHSYGAAATTGASSFFAMFLGVLMMALGVVFVMRRGAAVPQAPAEKDTVSDTTPCAEKGKAYETL